LEGKARSNRLRAEVRGRAREPRNFFHASTRNRLRRRTERRSREREHEMFFRIRSRRNRYASVRGHGCARVHPHGRDRKDMPTPLRVALLLNPFAFSRSAGDHAAELGRELAALGHVVHTFGGAPAARASSAGLDRVGPKGFAPDAILAYDALSPAAWLGARTARSLRIPLILVESGTRSGKSLLSPA